MEAGKESGSSWGGPWRVRAKVQIRAQKSYSCATGEHRPGVRMGGSEAGPNKVVPSLHMWVKQWGCARCHLRRCQRDPLEEPEWPKHHPTVRTMVTSLTTSAVEGLLVSGGDK